MKDMIFPVFLLSSSEMVVHKKMQSCKPVEKEKGSLYSLHFYCLFYSYHVTVKAVSNF